MRFRDKVALITAAGSGIGRATAEIIGAEGGAVVGVDTDKARLDALVDPIRRGGGQAEARRADGLDPAQVTEAVDGVARAHGRIDILVNAVGGSTIIARPAATVDELTLAEWQRLIAFNLDATFLFCAAVAPGMKRQRSGKVVNISSIAGRGISPTSSSAYAAAKGGIIAFTRKLAHELGPFGAPVNAIAPSLTLTERIRPHWDRRTPEQQAAEIAHPPEGARDDLRDPDLPHRPWKPGRGREAIRRGLRVPEEVLRADRLLAHGDRPAQRDRPCVGLPGPRGARTHPERRGEGSELAAQDPGVRPRDALGDRRAVLIRARGSSREGRADLRAALLHAEARDAARRGAGLGGEAPRAHEALARRARRWRRVRPSQRLRPRLGLLEPRPARASAGRGTAERRLAPTGRA